MRQLLISCLLSFALVSLSGMLQPIRSATRSKSIPTATPVAGTAVIVGTLIDSLTGQAVVGASIRIVSMKLGAASDIDGRYTIPAVPPGEYSLVITHLEYQQARIEAVVVKDHAKVRINCRMKPFGLVERSYRKGQRPNFEIDAPGHLAGMVLDSVTAKPIANAQIRISGTKMSAVSDDDGNFEIYRIPAGKYSLTIVHPLYLKKDIDRTTISKGRYSKLNIKLHRRPDRPEMSK